ncbi:class I lanthipeptide [Taibaiella soli]|uniref:Uncharacterized protein n=1 Tax=Taibaiella soli TaxID=1649169 RepID=A0A2W2C2T9_9BACT|nr:class I lanthipeptide [Taibaiella soli]PZF74423.1 hypothetical protein DN068_02260 [Taibaiella soli]
MKKTKIDAAKLKLHKEKILNLTSEQMNEVKGGGTLWSLIGCCKSTVEPDPTPDPSPSTIRRDSYCICTV